MDTYKTMAAGRWFVFFYNLYQLLIDQLSSNQLLLVLFNAQATNRG
ncbi:Uncharacterised protein [Sphingobacterium multivorum]|nr:Uncharacterised protein [Sphingobacterium multivorum]